MGRYYYPNETNALEAKIQFLREHHYQIRHCFMNDGGKGYVNLNHINRQLTRPTLSLTCDGHNSNYKYEKEKCFQKVA